MTNQSDQQLFSRIQKGDEHALRLVFNDSFTYLVRVALGYVKDQQQAKDMVQDVFLDFWNRRDSISITHSIRAYLRKAVVFRCLATIRKWKKESSSENLEQQVKRHAPSVEQWYNHKELNDILMIAMDKMPERCRAVFQASRKEGLSHKEIQEKLDISGKTIENQMTKALKIVRLVLKDHDILFWFILLGQTILYYTIGEMFLPGYL